MATEDNEQIQQRREKLARWRETGRAYPNDFRREDLAADIHEKFADATKESLAENIVNVSVAGRLMTRRIMGKASFADIQDVSGTLQLYVSRDDLPEGVYNEQFKKLDIGDIIGVHGVVYRTNKGELSIRASQVILLTKGLRPLPEKFHGITDAELRYRQRYVDLIVTEKTRSTFHTRSAMINHIRGYMMQRSYLEVETPMMHVIPGGAVARPFVTHHNTLDMGLYLRIAPELYLKRLVVGGFERVFEINRNFRNEGVSSQHNPEFTMMEFYQAYANYVDFMDLTEDLIRSMAAQILDATTVSYQGMEIKFGDPFVRISMTDAVLGKNGELNAADLNDKEKLSACLRSKGGEVKPQWGCGKLVLELFEQTVEETLIQPTFVVSHPVEVSPLSRRSDDNPEYTDRFELFIAGREIANGFSELNDPDDQAERFREQVRALEGGDNEAMHFDADYIRALEYGMPPTAGEGIGIDRLVMLFTDSASIRDVLLFPHMRHET